MEPAEHDPFEGLPPELRRMMEQFGGGQEMFAQLQSMLFGGGATTGPVNWDLARRVAFQLAADGDRNPTEAEVADATEAFLLAEHWLDEGSLPAPLDGGTVHVVRRGGWVDAALTAMRPVVEPVAAASTRALADLAGDLPDDLSGALEGMPPAFAQMLGGMDLSAMLRPLGATLAGMQVGQVVGQLSRQLLGQYDLGIPTAPRSQALRIAVNAHEVFDGWDLDTREVSVALALHEAAHRRLFHAVPWLEAHIHGLVAQFANGTRVDPEQLQGMAQEMMLGVDPDDPESLQEAMARAADFRLEPTPEQQRILDRLQGVVCLVQAWARHEVAHAAEGRLTSMPNIEEVLRRRRATQGDGEALLAQLLGLDLRPEDETVGDAFVQAVSSGRGTEGLRDALAHPENLPEREELGDPSRWLVRMAAADAVPDDPSAVFGLGDAPVEASADERARDQSTGDEDGGEPSRDDRSGDEDGGDTSGDDDPSGS
jgi:putative hydrolase